MIYAVCGPAAVHGPLLRNVGCMTVTFPQVSEKSTQALKGIRRC